MYDYRHLITYRHIESTNVRYGATHSMMKSTHGITLYSGYISLLLSRLPKLLSQCYLILPGSLGSLGSSKEI